VHRPFNLYKRSTTRPGKYIYYVQFYDDVGNRMTARSTGQTSKGAAEAWAIEQLRKGLISANKNITFSQYAQNWWIWEKCGYVKGKLARGSRISRGYVDAMRGYLDNHILPVFGHRKLQRISTRMIEQWVMDLREKPGKSGKALSHTTVNHCLRTLKIMLKEAKRLGYRHDNPAEAVQNLVETPAERGILRLDEVRDLFRDEDVEQIWGGDQRHYTINLLSASTGMRLGEVLALQVQYVFDDYVTVMWSYRPPYGFREPKRNSRRTIPIPTKTSACLHELISCSPFQESGDLVFFGQERDIPISQEKIGKALYKALERIGITPEERKTRNVSFHSWRHFYNRLMRGKIHDSKLQRLTGHRTQQMTEHYTHFNISDFQDVLRIQEEYFS